MKGRNFKTSRHFLSPLATGYWIGSKHVDNFIRQASNYPLYTNNSLDTFRGSERKKQCSYKWEEGGGQREREIGVAGMRERDRFRGTEYERKLSVFLLWHHHGVATIRIHTILYNNKIRRSRTYAQVLLTYYTGLNDLYNLCHIAKYNYFKWPLSIRNM